MKREKCLNRISIVWWQRILLLLFTFHSSLFTFSQIGTWKTYLSYYGIQQIEAAGNDIFVLSSNSLWSYNKNDQSIMTYDKNNGLNDRLHRFYFFTLLQFYLFNRKSANFCVALARWLIWFLISIPSSANVLS